MDNATAPLTIIEFLNARLDEDEEEARQEKYDEWWMVGVMDPERVLRDITAKRAIVDHAERWFETLRETPEGWTEQTCTAYRMAMEWTLRQLATAYADHPDV